MPDSQLKTSKKPSRWYKVIKKDNKKELNIGVVVEDSAALGPVPLHASGDEVLVAGDEEEVVVDELQPHLLVHAEQRVVVALEVAAELAEGGLHEALHVEALLLGDSGREAESLDAAADADPHRLDGSPWGVEMPCRTCLYICFTMPWQQSELSI